MGTNGWDSMKGNTLNQAYSYLNQKDNAWGLTPTCGELAVKVNTASDPAEAQKLSDEVMELALAQHRIYPLTYTNYVIVSQKNVTGLIAARSFQNLSITWAFLSTANHPSQKSQKPALDLQGQAFY